MEGFIMLKPVMIGVGSASITKGILEAIMKLGGQWARGSRRG
jgi:hypothetical protein